MLETPITHPPHAIEATGPPHRSEATLGALIEHGLPFRELSLLIEADRRALDPVYGAHRWWARRPPALMRGLLLAAALPATAGASDFWKAFGEPSHSLSGLRVHDPFAGGGSTLVEAARLGAIVTGGDVDPLAVEIVRHELDPATAAEVEEAGAALLLHLSSTLGRLYPAAETRQPLHYFWLHHVTCPTCKTPGLLYRNLIIARDTQRPGAVVRDAPLIVFCPLDLTVHELSAAERRELRHCGRRLPLSSGTFRSGRYVCPSCGGKSTHAELQTGAAPRTLIAVEETVPGAHRRIRAPVAEDLAAVRTAQSVLADASGTLYQPTGALSQVRHDDRPISYGIDTPIKLFSDRQRLVLGSAMSWLRDTDLEPQVRRALTLAVTNALATNNKLCSYATDYGRLSALFSVRGYALPSLSVELNPLHPGAGRGTIRNCIERVVRSATPTVRRHRWSVEKERPEPVEMTFAPPPKAANVRCVAAEMPTGTNFDVGLFDPPYYDYIAYDELSEFYRAWLDGALPAGSALHPTGENGPEQFGRGFAKCLSAALSRLAKGGLLAFTYHSASADAWRAIGIALDEADLAITAVWPVRSDGHMGHHSHPGNCEWDLVIVCRRRSETNPARLQVTVAEWVMAAQPFQVRKADRISMELALGTAGPRFASPAVAGPPKKERKP